MTPADESLRAVMEGRPRCTACGAAYVRFRSHPPLPGQKVRTWGISTCSKCGHLTRIDKATGKIRNFTQTELHELRSHEKAEIVREQQAQIVAKFIG